MKDIQSRLQASQKDRARLQKEKLRIKEAIKLSNKAKTLLTQEHETTKAKIARIAELYDKSLQRTEKTSLETDS